MPATLCEAWTENTLVIIFVAETKQWHVRRHQTYLLPAPMYPISRERERDGGGRMEGEKGEKCRKERKKLRQGDDGAGGETR